MTYLPATGPFEMLKIYAGTAASFAAEQFGDTQLLYLAEGTLNETDTRIREVFSRLSQDQKNQVFGKVYEIAKMNDSTISGLDWGRDHAMENMERLGKALHRLGFLGDKQLHPVKSLSFTLGEGGLGSQYFSLSEKKDRNPLTGHVGYVNGMGIPTLQHAGSDAAIFSNCFLDGNNLHCVYHPTHQATPTGDKMGFIADAFRMKAVDGGSYTKTSYLIAQQWIDFLVDNPSKNYLQIASSEGAVHTAAALRLVKEKCSHFLSRIRVLAFCPAHFMLSANYPGVQIKNFVKKEDKAINPWAQFTNHINSSPDIIVVNHVELNDHPHNHLSTDYMKASRPFIQEFMRTGNLY